MLETPLGLLFRAFGCWHSRLGRPISCEGKTYRACLACGARRRFDTKRWSCYGPYYFENSPDIDTDDRPERRVAAREATGLALRRAS